MPQQAGLNSMEDPGIDQRAAADHEARAARFFEHAFCRFRIAHIAVSENGHGPYGFHDRTNTTQIDRATEGLGPRATVNCQGGNTYLFKNGRQHGALSRV